MTDNSNIKKAISKIEALRNLGKEINNSAKYLESLNESFKNIDNLDKSDCANLEIIEIFSSPIDYMANLKIENFKLTDATGSSAVLITNASDYFITHSEIDPRTTEIINNISATFLPNDKEIRINEVLLIINEDISNEFNEVNLTYSQWKIKIKSNSDLAKDLRTFLEHLKGYLKIKANLKGDPSWNKIYERIGIKGAAFEKAFLQQKTIFTALWEELTKITKKTLHLDESEMENIYKRFLDHTYSLVNLLDENMIIKQSTTPNKQ